MTVKQCRCGRIAEFPPTETPEFCSLHELENLVDTKIRLAEAGLSMVKIDSQATPTELARASLWAQEKRVYQDVLGLIGQIDDFAIGWFEVRLVGLDMDNKVAAVKAMRSVADITLRDGIGLVKRIEAGEIFVPVARFVNIREAENAVEVLRAAGASTVIEQYKAT